LLGEGPPVEEGQLVGLPSNTSGAGRDTDAEVVGQVGGHPHLVADTLGERSENSGFLKAADARTDARRRTTDSSLGIVGGEQWKIEQISQQSRGGSVATRPAGRIPPPLRHCSKPGISRS
jgi:hypothetical protein